MSYVARASHREFHRFLLGSAKKSYFLKQQGLASKSGVSNSKIQIFVDENSSSGLFSGMGSLAGSSSTSHSTASNKENTRKAGKWVRQKIPQRMGISQGPKFDVVPDAESESRNQAK